jgi:tetratricopeptide (TPR) repeat protein
MEGRLLGSLGKIAGIGGIALGVLFLLFKGVLEQQLLQKGQLSSEQAFAIVVSLMIFTFGIAVIGLIAWLIGRSVPDGQPIPPWGLAVILLLTGGVLGSAIYVVAQAKASSSSLTTPGPRTADGWSFDNCRTESQLAQTAFLSDPADTGRVAKLIECKNPVGYAISGSAKFYQGKYADAENDFRLALKNLPLEETQTLPLWLDNLASANIETGKYADAIGHFKTVLNMKPSDGARWDLARATLYQGQNDNAAYAQAIELLRGVDRDYRGSTQKGKVQIELAAAFVGKSRGLTDAAKDDALGMAKKELCEGIAQNDSFWRDVLKKRAPYPRASFKEEIGLLKQIGGGDIACSG